MSPFELTRYATHPYVKNNPATHGHFDITPLRHPAYSAPAVPFSWMSKENAERLRTEYGLDMALEHEPDLGFETSWMQDHRNQSALLECFFGHLRPRDSLCFFYAKEVPFVEDSRRVIVGVGRVLHVGDATEYKYSRPGKLRSMLWERMVQHSIRPPEFTDGFLMPYGQLSKYIELNPEIDPAPLVAFAPNDYFREFSYASEIVSHDAAIEALLACAGALERSERLLGGRITQHIQWVHDRIAEMWKMRGPCPGLGSALCAFGVEQGAFVAREIETKVESNEDPWMFLERVFSNPSGFLSTSGACQLSKTLCEKWRALPAERRSLLKLLSRFNLTPTQAALIYVKEERGRAHFNCSDLDILKNPYLIYEHTRLSEDPVGLNVVDRGVFPDEVVRMKHPLPAPSTIDGGTDKRRVRAFVTQTLEQAAAEGNTLMRKADVILAIRDLDIKPSCPLDEDLLRIIDPVMTGVVRPSRLKDGTECYQLVRFDEIGQVIRNKVSKRCKGKPFDLHENWRKLLDEALPALLPDDEQEERARVEKAAALTVLAKNRLSLLVGPAGTGKTTLLSVFCGHPDILSGNILFLAPTGKARVRMEQAAKDKGLKIQGFTIAQFLSDCDRYEVSTGQYKLSEAAKKSPAKTVIIDECSMLTEEMLAATLDALQGVDRLILVGDPRQLPPIGAGRPFVDLVSLLAPQGIENMFPRVSAGYAELTVRRRQRQSGEKTRDDVELAKWFGGTPMGPGDDEIIDRVLFENQSPQIVFKEWNLADDLEHLLLETVCQELKLSGTSDGHGFEQSLGAKTSGGYNYFNTGAALSAENWQVLTPVRKKSCGVESINRLLHSTFRKNAIELATRDRYRKIPSPMGVEQIIYGDKIINLRNHRRTKVYPPTGATAYLANGEIGIAVGQFRTPTMKSPPWLLKVEFSSQPGFQYDFRKDHDFCEEGAPALELAYALTVHKAQGSEFGTVILIVPNPCRLLSRELFYTALTRQKNRIVVLHQGNRSSLRDLTKANKSEVARRLTNLFVEPCPVEHMGTFYEQNLIHRTRKGDMVRSKSELLIAERLIECKIDFSYELPLNLGGKTRFPDFTIEDSEAGIKFYWEHCGMLNDPDYRERWSKKLRWYRENKILPAEEGGGDNGTLIVTADNDVGGISAQEIEHCIVNYLGYAP